MFIVKKYYEKLKQKKFFKELKKLGFEKKIYR